MHWMALAGLLLVGGCVPAISTEPKPGQEAALDTIFRELGEVPGYIPIVWNSLLDCADGTGFTVTSKECAGATTQVDVFERPVYVIMADVPSGPIWGDLAHEVCHWTKGDHEHKGPCNDASEVLTRVRAALATPR